MNAARLVGAVASGLIHAAMLVTLPAAQPLTEPPHAVMPKDGTDESAWRLLPSLPAGVGLACAEHYRGIGAITSWSGYVREVVSGGPAEKAGLRVGDRFMNDAQFMRDFYPIGKQLSLRIERDGKSMDLPVQIDRICFDKGPA